MVLRSSRLHRPTPSPRWCFVWLMPLLWASVSYSAFHHPGDEYAMFFVGSAAGIWIFAVIDTNSAPRELLPMVLAAGAATVALFGLLLDLLRAPRRVWAVLLAAVAIVVCATSINSYPSYARAISKNGSLATYIWFSLNLGLYIATLAMLVVMPFVRLFRRRLPPGHCGHCGYDLTGNTSGRCPECGREAGTCSAT